MQVIIFLNAFVCLLIAIYGFKKKKSIFNPITVFCAIWGLVPLLASFRFYGINATSDATYIITFAGIFSFIFGCLLAGKFNVRKNLVSDMHEDAFTFDINKFLCYLMIIAAISILTVTAVASITLMIQGNDLAYIRYIAHDEVISSDGGFLDILYNYIAQPICILLIPVSIINIFSGQRDKKLIIGTIIVIVMLIISNGGRFTLLYFLIDFLFISALFSRYIVKKIKLKGLVLFVFSVSILCLALITTSRGSSLLQTLYIDFSGCMPHLDLRIANFDHIDGYTYGLTSFQGFIRPFFALIRKIGLIQDLPLALQQAQYLSLQVEQAISLGGNIKFNGFVSIFYSFYVDFNMYGVILLSMLYGFICQRAFDNMKSNFTCLNVIIYSLLLLTLVTSVVRFQFTSFIFALSFIYLFILKLRYKKKEIQQNQIVVSE